MKRKTRNFLGHRHQNLTVVKLSAADPDPEILNKLRQPPRGSHFTLNLQLSDISDICTGYGSEIIYVVCDVGKLMDFYPFWLSVRRSGRRLELFNSIGLVLETLNGNSQRNRYSRAIFIKRLSYISSYVNRKLQTKWRLSSEVYIA